MSNENHNNKLCCFSFSVAHLDNLSQCAPILQTLGESKIVGARPNFDSRGQEGQTENAELDRTTRRQHGGSEFKRAFSIFFRARNEHWMEELARDWMRIIYYIIYWS